MRYPSPLSGKCVGAFTIVCGVRDALVCRVRDVLMCYRASCLFVNHSHINESPIPHMNDGDSLICVEFVTHWYVEFVTY